MKRLIKAAALCLAFSLVMLMFVSAATPEEMYENGVVSDDGIRLGDERDGIVSDVSEGGEIFTGEGTGMLGDMTGDLGVSENNDMTSTPDITSERVTTDSPMTTSEAATDNTTNGANNEDGGSMATGVIIAVIVVIAVVVIIFLLLPKRRG